MNWPVLRTKLVDLRKSRGFTQSALAKASGIGVKIISAYESPTRPSRLRAIRLEQLDAIVRACESTLSEFLAGPVGERTPPEEAPPPARVMTVGQAFLADYHDYPSCRSSLGVEHAVRLP